MSPVVLRRCAIVTALTERRRSVLPLGAEEALVRLEMKYPAMKPAKTPVTNRRTSAIPLELLQVLLSL